MSDWRKDLLKAIGAKPTKANLRFLTTWQRWEGGHTNNDARFNWLNTTKDAPGVVASINSVGVKRFDTYRHGIQATAATLANGHYDDIVRGLKSGDPYSADVSRGLQTWVAGPNGSNPGYVAKVLGRPYEPSKPPTKKPKPQRPQAAAPQKPNTRGLDMLMGIDWGDDDEFLESLRSKNYNPVTPAYEPPRTAADAKGKGKGHDHDHAAPAAKGGFLALPTHWDATHVTDGLGWGTNSAIDIMEKPGTRVGAPEDAVVVYWKPTGAQGGGSMLLRTKSGREYWIGHVANGVRAGTRVRRGQRIADVSADHAAPHVHLDRRG